MKRQRYIIIYQDISYKDIFRWETYIAEDEDEMKEARNNLRGNKFVHRISVYELGEEIFD